MLLHEANRYLKKHITEKQLDSIHIIYCLLDLDKDVFCKIVDAIGVDVLVNNENVYRRLAEAEQELKQKEEYIKATKKLEELEIDMEKLCSIVNSYKKTI